MYVNNFVVNSLNTFVKLNIKEFIRLKRFIYLETAISTNYQNQNKKTTNQQDSYLNSSYLIIMLPKRDSDEDMMNSSKLPAKNQAQVNDNLLKSLQQNIEDQSGNHQIVQKEYFSSNLCESMQKTFSITQKSQNFDKNFLLEESTKLPRQSTIEVIGCPRRVLNEKQIMQGINEFNSYHLNIKPQSKQGFKFSDKTQGQQKDPSNVQVKPDFNNDKKNQFQNIKQTSLLGNKQQIRTRAATQNIQKKIQSDTVRNTLSQIFKNSNQISTKILDNLDPQIHDKYQQLGQERKSEKSYNTSQKSSMPSNVVPSQRMRTSSGSIQTLFSTSTAQNNLKISKYLHDVNEKIKKQEQSMVRIVGKINKVSLHQTTQNLKKVERNFDQLIKRQKQKIFALLMIRNHLASVLENPKKQQSKVSAQIDNQRQMFKVKKDDTSKEKRQEKNNKTVKIPKHKQNDKRRIQEADNAWNGLSTLAYQETFKGQQNTKTKNKRSSNQNQSSCLIF